MLEPPYVGIDLDDCIDGGGLNAFAREVIQKCGSYVEYSPSRTGIHILGKGSLTQSLKKPYIEAYQNQRYFTVTEKPVFPVRPFKEINLSFLDQYRDVKPTGPLDLGTKLSTIQEGSRNNDFTSIAGSLRGNGYSATDIFELLKPKAIQLEFDEKELWTICKSVGRYTPNVPPPDVCLEGSNSFTEFMADTKTQPYLIPGLIAENTINVIAGLQESRKSWLLLDMAVALASGTDWLNKFPCQRRKVMLIDQERPKLEMQRRLKALIAGKGLKINDLEGFLVPRAGTTIRVNLDRSYEHLCRTLEEIKPDVLLVDSLKTFQTGNINDNQSMQAVFERIKEIRLKYGLTVVILHHENKGAYLRAREGLEITAEMIAGAASIAEVPEGIFVSVPQSGEDASILCHVKNSYGLKQGPETVKVTDMKEDKSQIKVETF